MAMVCRGCRLQASVWCLEQTNELSSWDASSAPPSLVRYFCPELSAGGARSLEKVQVTSHPK